MSAAASLRIHDLSLSFSPGMPKYPASWFPAFRMNEIKPGDIPEAHWKRRFTSLELFVHNGTHVESSDHILRNGKCINHIPLSHFAGFPIVLDFTGHPDATPITEQYLSGKLSGIGVPPDSILLIRTDYNDRNWGRDRFWEDSPYLTPGAAHVISRLEPALVGLDFQTEKYRETDFPVHHELLKNNTVLCEYLFNLKSVRENSLFMAMPVKIQDAEASCVRAVAVDGLGDSLARGAKTIIL